ncbi:hypothetical protein JOD97_005534 [Duganella sp. 1411]|uniref:hypothetical protein n=1 Tax=Duganella sp. 1411 TaxID=2806572 RepID=UPI001AE5B9E8|nr:hypothetical protein [Duganella sp. 1411]MBP1207454.1 hypothetical protein [Duganella sp. 1411]
MSGAIKKVPMSSAYPAATSLFEQLAGLFASPATGNKLTLKSKQLDALLNALQQAPVDEVAAVSRILEQVSARLFELNNNSGSTNQAREDGTVRLSEEKAATNEDSIIRGLLAGRRKESLVPEQTAVERHANAEVMDKLRREAAASLQRRIDSKELLPPKEFQDALGISRQSINEAVKARRMFALLGPAGEYYYPAFYADGHLHRRELEKVAKALGGLPAASKYHFFTSKSTYLGAATPLEALRKGRVEEVLIAAAAFEQR